jgi:hypothetical protein
MLLASDATAADGLSLATNGSSPRCRLVTRTGDTSGAIFVKMFENATSIVLAVAAQALAVGVILAL